MESFSLCLADIDLFVSWRRFPAKRIKLGTYISRGGQRAFDTTPVRVTLRQSSMDSNSILTIYHQ